MAAFQALYPKVDSVVTWCKDHALKISPSKTQLTYLSRQRAWTAAAFPNARIDGHHPDHKRTLDLLGIRLDASLTLGAHARKVSERAAARTTRLRTVMSANRRIPRWTGKVLYQTMIRPIFLFGAPLLLMSPQRSRRPVEVGERRALRAILRCPIGVPTEDLYRTAQVQPITTAYEVASTKFLKWCVGNRNRRILQSTKEGPGRREDSVYWSPPLQRCLALLPRREQECIRRRIEELID